MLNAQPYLGAAPAKRQVPPLLATDRKLILMLLLLRLEIRALPCLTPETTPIPEGSFCAC